MTTTGQLGTPVSSPGLIALGGTAPTQLTLIMRALAGSLDTAGIVANVYDYPVETIHPPCAVVGFPTTIDFDMRFGSYDMGELTVPVWFACGRTGTEDARNVLSDVLSGAGSIKELLDSTAAYPVRVSGAEVTELVVAGVPYLAARFDCEVIG